MNYNYYMEINLNYNRKVRDRALSDMRDTSLSLDGEMW